MICVLKVVSQRIQGQVVHTTCTDCFRCQGYVQQVRQGGPVATALAAARLRKLQQLPEACHDTQVGSGGLRSLATARAPMTMEEILEVLTNKARIEAEDAQRVLLAALNGLAALMLLEHNEADAVQAYREVGQSGDPGGSLLGVL